MGVQIIEGLLSSFGWGEGDEEDGVGGGDGDGDGDGVDVGVGIGVGNECNGPERPYWTDLTTSSSSYFKIKEEEAKAKDPRLVFILCETKT